ncbi:HAD family hydrolase [Staphylococcus durrellii]|uniref:HAD family hydrolase n=1 Tax=Staphylococcus durrellii TaxID=2781773 RepID=UPI00189EA0BE|nr:HAD family hydrolase [Staphylococcus durrellii]MBF7016397.1 HAD family hydrolase [Staphylococcus durrellii]
MYKAVVFDFDGTIIDTEKHLYEIINKHLIDHNHQPMSLEFYTDSIGGAAEDLHQFLEDKLGKEQKEQMYIEHHKTSKNLPIFDEVKALMEYLKKRHIPMAIATSSYRTSIEPTFKKLGLENYIDAVIGREDVSEVKPNPELYLKAVQALNYNPANCLAIEDSVNGATAAINAGLDVIVNTNAMTEKQNFANIAYVSKDVDSESIIAKYFES